jgi:hypothetical protein
MAAFLVTPEGAVHNVERIGGAKAVEDGFLLLGTAPDEILEWMEVPTAVAMAWRDAVAALLAAHRPRRPLKQLEWLKIAAGVDLPWAETQGWTAPEPTPVAALQPVVAAAPPVRRLPDRESPVAA